MKKQEQTGLLRMCLRFSMHGSIGHGLPISNSFHFLVKLDETAILAVERNDFITVTIAAF
jgi:hypothetical protein